MSTIETIELGNYRATVKDDEYPGDFDPRDNDNLGIMVVPGTRRYDLGDRSGDERNSLARAMEHYAGRPNAWALLVRYARIYHGSTVVLPLFLLDHSGLSMRTGPFHEDPGGWDSGLVGIIVDTAATRAMTGTPLDRVEDGLRAEVREYDAWLQGSVVLWYVERVDTCELGHEHETVVDSCGGYLIVDYPADLDNVRQEARAALEWRAAGGTVTVTTP